MGESIVGKLNCAEQQPKVRPQDVVLQENELRQFFSQFGDVDKVLIRKTKANANIKMFGISFFGHQTATEHSEILFGNLKVLKFTKTNLIVIPVI